MLPCIPPAFLVILESRLTFPLSLVVPAAAILAGYFIGSIPTAFLVVRRKLGLDIRGAGSGNVGGYNAATVTGSTGTGVLVGVLDALKGVVASFGAWLLFPDDVMVQYAAFLGAIVGHNYPVWLKFKGGRGLATAAGAMFGVGVFFTAAWVSSWVVLFLLFKKDILKANLGATILAPVLTWVVPTGWVQVMMVRRQSVEEYAVFVTVLSFFLLLSHAEVLKPLLPSRNASTP